MYKFLAFALLFVSGLLLLDRGAAWVCDRVYERIRVGQKGGLINTYLALPLPPPVLMMGNSCMGCNLDPDSLHMEAYSIAHNGTRQIFQTGLLSLLQQKNKLPRAILLHVDLQEYVAPCHLEDIANLKYYYGQAPYITKYYNELSRWEPLKFGFTLYRHNGQFFSLIKNWRRNPSPEPNQGYEPISPTAQDSIKTLYTANRMMRMPGKLNRKALRYLEDFTALCRSNNIRLVCYTSTYYEAPPWLPAASAVVDSLLRAEGVPYVNLALHPVAKLTGQTWYWRDETHLNTRGIPLMSQAVARQVVRLLNRPTALATSPEASPRHETTSLTAISEKPGY